MRFKFLTVFAALLLLASCGGDEPAPTTSGSTTATAPAPAGPPPGSQEELLVKVGDRIFFDTDKSELKREARATLERLAAWMNENPGVAITIEGHCDERGTREYNLALGDRRAAAARNYLIALGTNSARLGTISYGKERPAVPGHTEAAWAQNRRAVFQVR